MENLSKEQREQVKALYEIRNQAKRLKEEGKQDQGDNLDIALLRLLQEVPIVVFKALAKECKNN